MGSPYIYTLPYCTPQKAPTGTARPHPTVHPSPLCFVVLSNRMRVIYFIDYQPSYPTEVPQRGNAEQLKIPVGLRDIP